MGTFVDLTGKEFNNMTALRYLGGSKWECQCNKCHNIFIKQTVQFKRNGCNYCVKKHINEDYFKEIDCENKAYYFGLLWADGYCSLEHKIMKIDLQDRDIDILQKLNEDIESSLPLTSYIAKANQSFRPKDEIVRRLAITNINFIKNLTDKGLVAHREDSHFPFEYVRKEFWFDFIRGYFDGNGSIADCHVVNICGGTVILDDIGNILDEYEIKHNYHRRRPNNLSNNTLYIRGGKDSCKKFLDLMYKNATVYLNRKYEKYLKF